MASNAEGSPAGNFLPSISEAYQVISENSEACVICKKAFTNCICKTLKNVVNGDGNDHCKYQIICKQAWYIKHHLIYYMQYNTNNVFCFSCWKHTNTITTYCKL